MKSNPTSPLIKTPFPKYCLVLLLVQFLLMCAIIGLAIILYSKLNDTTTALSQLKQSFENSQNNIANSTSGTSGGLTKTDLDNAISSLLTSMNSQIGSVNSSINLAMSEPKMQINGTAYSEVLVNPVQLK